ncbi:MULTISPECIES: LytR/AlgR family response regulator transcription factor [Bacillus]|uniref:LytR/AlgR family response regulator transcription factor n=1 Tax=Bacillus TaxID=1386 RepID=UPI000BB79EF2|nr:MULTISPECIES: LytTR family DNA-binding domain-containing protein [Bacillus]
MSLKVLIVEDNTDAVEILQYFLDQIEDVELLGVCENGESLVNEVIVQKPNLILADINMPIKNGIEAIKECLSIYPDLKFIFITGYDEYAIEAFQLSAIDYIVKPLQKERLTKAINKAKTLIAYEQNDFSKDVKERKINNISIKDQTSTIYIPLQDICFIEKLGKKCIIYTKDEAFETTETIGSVMERLDDSFILAHRSFIINTNKVSQIVPQAETFIAYFHDVNKQASISKLKINDVKERISFVLKE